MKLLDKKLLLELTVPELLERKVTQLLALKLIRELNQLAGSSKETVTEGLDGLRERLEEYYKLGARFTKWRGVYSIEVIVFLPHYQSIKSNAHALARYAAMVQEANMVPIVEPEVLMDGSS